MVTSDDLLQADRSHGAFRLALHVAEQFADDELYVHADAAFGVGVRIQVKQGFVAFYGAVYVQHRYGARFTGEPRFRVPGHAFDQPCASQLSHHLTNRRRICGEALRSRGRHPAALL